MIYIELTEGDLDTLIASLRRRQEFLRLLEITEKEKDILLLKKLINTLYDAKRMQKREREVDSE